MDWLKQLASKAKDAKAILGLIVFVISLTLGFLLWANTTYVIAEEEIKNNAQLKESIDLQQNMIQESTSLFKLEIAKLKLDGKREKLDKFIIVNGDDVNKMNVNERGVFLDLKVKFEEAETHYNHLLEQ